MKDWRDEFVKRGLVRRKADLALGGIRLEQWGPREFYAGAARLQAVRATSESALRGLRQELRRDLAELAAELLQVTRVLGSPPKQPRKHGSYLILGARTLEAQDLLLTLKAMMPARLKHVTLGTPDFMVLIDPLSPQDLIHYGCYLASGVPAYVVAAPSPQMDWRSPGVAAIVERDGLGALVSNIDRCEPRS